MRLALAPVLIAPGEARTATLLGNVQRMGNQRDWVELQRVLAAGLRQRGVVHPDGPLSAEDADFLADHLADDVYATFDLTARSAGVGSRNDKPVRVAWLRRRRGTTSS